MRLSIARVFTDREWAELTTQLEMSHRQAQIARCLLRGFGDKQIAGELGISVHTVRTYLARMFARLDVQDRNELIVAMFRRFRAGCLDVECPRC